jgi:hypothetical protein
MDAAWSVIHLWDESLMGESKASSEKGDYAGLDGSI